jgi:hypothetical protein
VAHGPKSTYCVVYDTSQAIISTMLTDLTETVASTHLAEDGSNVPLMGRIFTTITIQIWAPTSKEAPLLPPSLTLDAVPSQSQPTTSNTSTRNVTGATELPLYKGGAELDRLTNVTTTLAVVAIFLAAVGFITMMCLWERANRRKARVAETSPVTSSAYSDHCVVCRHRAARSSPNRSGEGAREPASSAPINLDEWLSKRRNEGLETTRQAGTAASVSKPAGVLAHGPRTQIVELGSARPSTAP